MKAYQVVTASLVMTLTLLFYQNCASSSDPYTLGQQAQSSTAVTPIVSPLPTPVPLPVTPPTIVTNTFGVAFGGMYGFTANNAAGFYSNPFTQTDSCPPGYSAYQIAGEPGSSGAQDFNVFVCTKPVQATDSVDYDFGGIYSTASGSYSGFNNPATNAQSCALGFTAYQIRGSSGVDQNLFFCARPFNAADTTGTLQYAGIYSLAPSSNTGFYKNQLTGAYSCPSGATMSYISGQTSVDHTIQLCTGPALPDSTATAATPTTGGAAATQ